MRSVDDARKNVLAFVRRVKACVFRGGRHKIQSRRASFDERAEGLRLRCGHAPLHALTIFIFEGNQMQPFSSNLSQVIHAPGV